MTICRFNEIEELRKIAEEKNPNSYTANFYAIAWVNESLKITPFPKGSNMECYNESREELLWEARYHIKKNLEEYFFRATIAYKYIIRHIKAKNRNDFYKKYQMARISDEIDSMLNRIRVMKKHPGYKEYVKRIAMRLKGYRCALKNPDALPSSLYEFMTKF